MFKRILIIFINRNREFYRDRSGLGWNILFPFFIIVGFSLIFSQDSRKEYKVGIINSGTAKADIVQQYDDFRKTKVIEFIEFESREKGIGRLLHHRIDLLIDPSEGIYWKSTTSPKSFMTEKLLIASSVKEETGFIRESVAGMEIPYIEWLFPGVLAMNMMFSALFGVGYSVVRDRKNGVLKRFSVTPLSPLEFLTAQILSRMFVILITTGTVYIACTLIYGFENRGSYLSLLLIFMLGSFSMVSLALIIASRSSSEEFAGGVLNLLSWPMMLLSEVWFSMEGARPWVITLSEFLPLTHITSGVRHIMNDGSSLYEIKKQILVLSVMSIIFLATGSALFKWQKDD
jgi:ABC-type multidrug transport system permease subunit